MLLTYKLAWNKKGEHDSVFAKIFCVDIDEQQKDKRLLLLVMMEE